MLPRCEVGQVVASIQGRDQGSYYVVIGVQDDRYIWMADGRHFTCRKAKKKNRRHVTIHSDVSSLLSEKLKLGVELSDNDVRAAINALVRK